MRPTTPFCRGLSRTVVLGRSAQEFPYCPTVQCFTRPATDVLTRGPRYDPCTRPTRTFKEPTMRYRADLHCYLCSRSAATLEWEGNHPALVNVNRPGQAVAQMGPQEARGV